METAQDFDNLPPLSCHLMHPGARELRAYAFGAPADIEQIDIWKLHPTNQGYLEAKGNRTWEPETA